MPPIFFWLRAMTSFGIFMHHSPESSKKGVSFLDILCSVPFALSLHEGREVEVRSTSTGAAGEEAEAAGATLAPELKVTGSGPTALETAREASEEAT